MSQEQLQAMTDVALNEQVVLHVCRAKVIPPELFDIDDEIVGHDYEVPLVRIQPNGSIWMWTSPNDEGRPYSPATDISDAWQVMEKIGLSVIHSADGWYATKAQDVVWDYAIDEVKLLLPSYGAEPSASAPRAICIAALMAVQTSPTTESR